MSIVTHDPLGPMSSGEIPIGDLDRGMDIEQKHQKVTEFLQSHQYDALLLRKPSNFAWLTSGGECSRGGTSGTTAGLFVTPQARVVLCSNVDSGQLFDRELPGLGFQLKERPWHEPRHVLMKDLCQGRLVVGDCDWGRINDVSVHLTGIRVPLTNLECERMRELGQSVAHSVEATARQFEQEQTEAEIAGELSHRLLKHQITPERIQVCADGRSQRYRHWSFGTDTVARSCVISAVARKWGLCVGVARTVCFGDPPAELHSAHQAATLTQATGMYFSKADWELFETWNRVQRIYDKFGHAEEWQCADQAGVIGYEVCEVPVVPKSEFRLSAQTAVFWHPSVGPALVGDTMLVTETAFEVLTPTENWPTLKVDVKGTVMERPGILRRELAASGGR